MSGGPGPGLGPIDLSRNEGDVLTSGETLAALLDEAPALLRAYPAPAPLEEALARYVGVEPGRVLATTGADDAIDRVFKWAVSPGAEEVVIPDPTFEMVPAFARIARGRLVPVRYSLGRLPLEELRAAVTERTAVVAVITPDNPTGVPAPAEGLIELARSLPRGVTLMVDQAYGEFADEDPTAALLEMENVVLIRTLSKAWGLAGLRIGYAVSTADRIAALRRVGGPYAVSGLAVRIASRRITLESGTMRQFVADTARRRELLRALLEQAGASTLPSQANFVLARFPDVGWVHRGLEAQGIRTRILPHLPDRLRITVPRTESEMVRLQVAIQRLSSPDAVLFDMDGVLADVRRSYREAIRATCLAYGVAVDEEGIAAAKAHLGANDDWRVTHRLLSGAGVEVPLEQVTATFESLYQGTPARPGLWRHESLVPDRALLRSVASRMPLGVVTGRPRRDAVRFLREHELEGLFGAVVCREDAPLKPSNEPVRLALEALGVGSAWFLGDTPDDMAAASGAGVIPLGVVAPGGGARQRRALEEAGAARVVEAGGDLGGVLHG